MSALTNLGNSPRPTQLTQIGHEPTYDRVHVDFETLDCYQAASKFNALTTRLVPRGQHELREQLACASLAILLSCAESTGRIAPTDKAHFFSTARGSAMECVGSLDVLLSSGMTSVALYREARALLIRIVQMLTRLEAACRGATVG